MPQRVDLTVATPMADASIMQHTSQRTPRRIGYQNLMLTAIAAMLALGLVERGGDEGSIGPAAAQAQPESDGGGLTNKLEQNKQIISELRLLNSKVDRIEARLAGGLSVKVTDMPALKLPPEMRGKPQADAAPKGDQAAAEQPKPAAPKPGSVVRPAGAADGK